MPVWMWLNIPLMVLVIVAVVGIPYWLVLRHPDQDAPTLRGPARAARRPATAATEGPAEVPAQARPEERVGAANGHRYEYDYSAR